MVRTTRRTNPRGDEELRALAREAQRDPAALDRYMVELGRHGRLWVALVTGKYQKVAARLFDPETQTPRGRGAQFFAEIKQYGGHALDLNSMSRRGALRKLLEELRTRYGAQCRYLELREEWEAQGSPHDDLESWASRARRHAKEQRKAGVIGWNPPRGDEELRALERTALQTHSVEDAQRLFTALARHGRVDPFVWAWEDPAPRFEVLWNEEVRPGPNADGTSLVEFFDADEWQVSFLFDGGRLRVGGIIPPLKFQAAGAVIMLRNGHVGVFQGGMADREWASPRELTKNPLTTRFSMRWMNRHGEWSVYEEGARVPDPHAPTVGADLALVCMCHVALGWPLSRARSRG